MQSESLAFIYRQQEYHAIVRRQVSNECTLYYITIMNGQLERQFYGHHVFRLADGQVQYTCQPEAGTVKEIATCVAAALQQKIQQCQADPQVQQSPTGEVAGEGN